jgi:hypothetical protein
MAERLDFLKGLGRGFGPDVLGTPVDLAESLLNLGIAGAGYVGHKTGLLDQPPALLKGSVGGSDWWAERANVSDPGTSAYTAGTVIPFLLGASKRPPKSIPALERAIEDAGKAATKQQESPIREGDRFVGRADYGRPGIFEVMEFDRDPRVPDGYIVRGLVRTEAGNGRYTTSKFALTADQLLEMQKHPLGAAKPSQASSQRYGGGLQTFTDPDIRTFPEQPRRQEQLVKLLKERQKTIRRGETPEWSNLP